ncbi:MAG: hypothetical protein R3F23_08255 [Verrucomicrobiia bacterium]
MGKFSAGMGRLGRVGTGIARLKEAMGSITALVGRISQATTKFPDLSRAIRVSGRAQSEELLKAGEILMDLRGSLDEIMDVLTDLNKSFEAIGKTGVGEGVARRFYRLSVPMTEATEAYDAALDMYIRVAHGKASRGELANALDNLFAKVKKLEQVSAEVNTSIAGPGFNAVGGGSTDYDNNPAAILALPVAPQDMADFVYSVGDQAANLGRGAKDIWDGILNQTESGIKQAGHEANKNFNQLEGYVRNGGYLRM